MSIVKNVMIQYAPPDT